MQRREMIEELLEQLEDELDELTNAQLSALITEYEHAQILRTIVENLDADEDEEEDVDDEEELPLIDNEWDEAADDEDLDDDEEE